MVANIPQYAQDILAQYATPRQNWQPQEVLDLFALPMNDLLFTAQVVHRAHFNPNEVQTSTLLSIKTGGCPENCKYCPQSARYDTPVKAEKLMDLSSVVQNAKAAKQAGATRFCMGAAWRSPKDRDMDNVIGMVQEVKALGLETCMTLGMLTRAQAQQLADAGLDYYNHNLDSAEDFYHEIITTRTYQDRLETLQHVAQSGMKTCCGGIVGMGETIPQRGELLRTLANLSPQPQSVPINRLVKVEGTPLAGAKPISDLDFVRMIAVARIMLPHSYVRLSAGRETMSETMQAMCFAAGANSIFYGEKLLTTANPGVDDDHALFAELGIQPQCAA